MVILRVFGDCYELLYLYWLLSVFMLSSALLCQEQLLVAQADAGLDSGANKAAQFAQFVDADFLATLKPGQANAGATLVCDACDGQSDVVSSAFSRLCSSSDRAFQNPFPSVFMPCALTTYNSNSHLSFSFTD